MQDKYLYRVCKKFMDFLLYGKVMYHPAHPASQTIFDRGLAISFYRWMLKKHINDHAPVGDLARDMKGDKQFPHDGDKATIQEYLEDCGACSGCMDAFEEAWAEYEGERSRTEACKSS